DKTYYNWMNDIQDWCISRQIWWGHRIPAWYDVDGNIYVGRNEAEVRQKNQLADDLVLTQDEDVLDTWFSSALWPFSTLGWPDKTPELDTFYPTSVLVTGFDIIFFWVARMIMMGLKFMDNVPFKEIYIHGLVRDAEGQKMSKSKGNVLDPIDLIDGITLEALLEKRTKGLMQPKMAKKIDKDTRKHFPDGIPAFGTDALRFTFASLASTGRDIRFDLNRIEGNRNFCNKLWNATRYVLMNTEGEDTGLGNEVCEYSLPDQWIVSRLQKTEASVIASIEKYRFDLAAHSLYEFLWNEYCDWYLELSKPILMDENSSGEQKRGTRQTLVRVLEAVLRLLHPIMPFITEEIWQQIAPMAGKSGDTIMLQAYPKPDDNKISAKAETDMNWVMNFVMGIRKIRGEMNIAPNKPLPVLLNNSSTDDQQRLNDNKHLLEKLARLESITTLSATDEAPQSATALVGDMQVLIPMAGLIDKDAELERLNKEIEKLEKENSRISGKLSNASFVDKAPAAVVEKEKAKQADISSKLNNLNEQKEKIASL
ncbi:MAG: class I tRNA ligase family protein, partial [Cycloclasticus sp.]